MTGSQSQSNLLNLGCGRRFNPGWTNVDIVPAAPGVMAHDLRQPLPFPDGSFDGVYHSHVLEHLPPDAGRELLRECHRVLRPGGILRVVVPDLEGLVRAYLGAIDDVRSGGRGSGWKHRWLTIELLDQIVRTVPGGLQLELMRQADANQREFIRGRVGAEAEGVWSARNPVESPAGIPARPPFLERLRWKLMGWLAGRDARSIAALRFRLQGEPHCWMYDEVSLGEAMLSAGFQNPLRKKAAESALPDWLHQGLDVDAAGLALKPDSLFMESRKGEGR